MAHGLNLEMHRQVIFIEIFQFNGIDSNLNELFKINVSFCFKIG